MKLPPLDLSKLITLLKKEGGSELSLLKPSPKPGKQLLGNIGISPIIDNWNEIIRILETEIVPMLSKGCEAKALGAPAKRLARRAGHLSLMASEILSFVPGPIGIICSVINAVVCFSMGNVVGGLLELLGCIPGGKVAGKATSKLFPKIERILIEVVQNNHTLKFIVETSSKQAVKVTEFVEKYGPKPKSKKFDTGYEYGVKTPIQPSSLENSLRKEFPDHNPSVQGQKEIGKYITFSNTYGNLPKSNSWSHLY